ncbi:MAG: NADH-quinone oxidoreductase subunit N [Streptosporangiales bacterium]|nr:NADH-quinone oxidoreductase subunit N [Streptosporangiales bacterium]
MPASVAQGVVQGVDLLAIAPPLWLALAAIAILIADPFLRRRRPLDYASLASVLVGLGFVVALAVGQDRRTFCVPPGLARGGPAPCSYVVDDFTLLFQGLVLLAAVVVLLMATPEVHASRLPPGEFHFLLLASVTGALTLAASRDLISLVVSLEVVSLPVFALTALRRYDGRASEAGLKMFLVSVVSTAVMLFGISLVYGVTGAVHLERIALVLADAAVPQTIEATVGPARPLVGAVGIMLVLAGFGFKVAAVPFHFWAPDTYQGAPLPVAAFLSVVSKAAGFAGLVLVLVVGFWPYGGAWGPLLAVIAAVTMSLGNLVALRQRHAVRLLAWSSIAQSGYMLAPLGAALTVAGGGAGGDAGAAPVLRDAAVFLDAAGATVAYVAIYAAMNLGAFAVVAAVARHRPRNNLEDYRGLARTNPLLGVALAFFLACLAGLPPGLAGLFAKIVVFRAAVSGSLSWLAIVMAINTAIGLYYYLAWAGLAFAGRRERDEVWRPVGVEDTPVPPTVGIAIGVAAAATIVISVAPELVLHVTPLAVAATG